MKNNILRTTIICILLICLFYFNTSKAEIIANAYTVNNENVIYDILEKTEISIFKTNMKLKADETIYSKESKEVKDGIIGTGMKVNLSDGKTYVLSVKGDISGDGKITASDILQLKKALVGIKDINTAEKLATDINEDDKISPTDLYKIKKYIVEEIRTIITEKGIYMDNQDILIDLSSMEITKKLEAQILPISATGEITFKSSDESIASVDNSGAITAKMNGDTIITAQSR